MRGWGRWRRRQRCRWSKRASASSPQKRKRFYWTLKTEQRRPQRSMSMQKVCSSCFADIDLRAWIRGNNGPRGCDFCRKFDSPTCKLEDVCEHIESCLQKYWGFAVNQLPYESAEGGYLGTTWTTYELLADEVGLALPRDNDNRLFHAIVWELTEEAWCEYDWLSLDHDVALRSSWDRFCKTVKHKRRFFFTPMERTTETHTQQHRYLIRLQESANAWGSFEN